MAELNQNFLYVIENMYELLLGYSMKKWLRNINFFEKRTLMLCMNYCKSQFRC